jgi:hypothetical protein
MFAVEKHYTVKTGNYPAASTRRNALQRVNRMLNKSKQPAKKKKPSDLPMNVISTVHWADGNKYVTPKETLKFFH